MLHCENEKKAEFANGRARSRSREGEFAGWQTYDLHGTFDQTVGPFYFKPDPDGRMRCAFRAEPKHMNAGHRMHGGCLMTFADIALFQTAYQEMEGKNGVTVQLELDLHRRRLCRRTGRGRRARWCGPAAR